MRVCIRIFIGLSILALCVVFYIFSRAFFLMDISKTPVKNHLKAPVYLVSYADGPEVFRQNQKMLAYSALKNGVSHIFSYNKQLLDPQFVGKHARTFTLAHGAGYWIWKPWIILDTLKKMPEDGYLIYCDSGFTIQKNIQPIVNLLNKYDVMLIAYEDKNHFNQQTQTKKLTLQKTGCTSKKCLHSYAILSGIILMKNTQTTRNFMRKWLELCEDEELLLDGEGLQLSGKERGEFHRHDQSLLGITYYLYPKKVAIISAEQAALKNYFRLHHRHPQEAKRSLVNKMNSGIRNWEFRVMDWPIFQKIAVYMYEKRKKASP